MRLEKATSVSENNSPVDCYGGRVRVGGRRERKSITQNENRGSLKLMGNLHIFLISFFHFWLFFSVDKMRLIRYNESTIISAYVTDGFCE